jgi:hypothetical protein
MRGVGTTTLAMTAVLACASWPAAAQTITVTPDSAHPGQKVHISVPGCSAGPTAHVAVSAAFTGNVTLYGKADTGDADPMIRQELKPGTYPVTAYCGARTVQGQISVTADDRPSAGHDDKTNNWLLIVVGLVIAGVLTVFLLGRRGRNVS